MDKLEFLKLVRAKMQARREARERPNSIKALTGLPIHARPKNFADLVRGELGRLEKDYKAAKREGDNGAAQILRRKMQELQALDQHLAHKEMTKLASEYELAKKEMLQAKPRWTGMTLDSVEEGMRQLARGADPLREMLGEDLDRRLYIPIKISAARGFRGYDSLENLGREEIQSHETTLGTLWNHLSSEERSNYTGMWQQMRQKDPELAASFSNALREELVKEAQKRLSLEHQKK